MGDRPEIIYTKTVEAQKISCPYCLFVFFVEKESRRAKIEFYLTFGFLENFTVVSIDCPKCKKKMVYNSSNKHTPDWNKIAQCGNCKVYNIMPADYAELGRLYRENERFEAICLHCGEKYSKDLRNCPRSDFYEKIADI